MSRLTSFTISYSIYDLWGYSDVENVSTSDFPPSDREKWSIGRVELISDKEISILFVEREKSMTDRAEEKAG